MDGYKDFNFNCTDTLARINSEVLIEQVSAANEPIMIASSWVRGIWIWVGIEFAILLCLCMCTCAAAAMSDYSHNIRENCRKICDDFSDFVKAYITLN